MAATVYEREICYCENKERSSLALILLSQMYFLFRITIIVKRQ